MKLCNEGTMRIIDRGLSANRKSGKCTCCWKDGKSHMCSYCKIRDALMCARACIYEEARRREQLVAKMEKRRRIIESQ